MANISNSSVANQVAFGQYGSTYTNTSGNVVTPPTGLVIVAISFLEDLSLDELTSADSGPATLNNENGGSGTNGSAVINATVFPKGMTIYGRWKEVSLVTPGTASGIIVYFGP